MFAKRLDEIMNIAGVSNSTTGRATAISGAHIGRLRNGTRPLPKEHDFLTPLCEYLARHITKDYQLTALVNLTGMNEDSAGDSQKTALYLENWLQEKPEDSAAGRFISGFSSYAAVSGAPSQSETLENEEKTDSESYYYGNEGKRRAVIRFFQAVLREKKPQTLLLYSDEPFAWLYEDVVFVRQWMKLFGTVLKKGNRVKIVHTVSRDMNEMMEGLIKWIPIYMTGAIEPYYYPRLRDGLFQRTMFIAPDTTAVTSTAVQQNTDRNLNSYVEDKNAVTALTVEFEQFLAQCRPLMRIFPLQKGREFIGEMNALAAAEGECIVSSDMPLLFSMPEALAREISEAFESPAFYDSWRESVLQFEHNINSRRITEIILSPATVLRHPDSLKLPMGSFLLAKDFQYTEAQYLSQIARLEELQEQFDNFTVIRKDKQPTNVLLYYKEYQGAVVAKTTIPSAAFTFSEQNMVVALGDYLKNEME